MSKTTKTIKKHPKIISTIAFFLIVGVISFIVGYRQDTKKVDKDGNQYSGSHHLLNGLKWLGIIYAIFFVIVIISIFLFSADFYTVLFFGGEVLGFLFQIIGELFTALNN